MLRSLKPCLLRPVRRFSQQYLLAFLLIFIESKYLPLSDINGSRGTNKRNERKGKPEQAKWIPEGLPERVSIVCLCWNVGVKGKILAKFLSPVFPRLNLLGFEPHGKLI